MLLFFVGSVVIEDIDSSQTQYKMRGHDVCGKQLTVVANYYCKKVSATDFNRDSNWCTVKDTYSKPLDAVNSKLAIVYFIIIS